MAEAVLLGIYSRARRQGGTGLRADQKLVTKHLRGSIKPFILYPHILPVLSPTELKGSWSMQAKHLFDPLLASAKHHCFQEVSSSPQRKGMDGLSSPSVDYSQAS